MHFYSYLGFDPEKNMYHTIVHNLFQFKEIDGLPFALKNRIEKLPSTEELSKLLMNNKAAFHKSCVALFNKQKLDRKRKIFEKQSKENEEPSKKNDSP